MFCAIDKSNFCGAVFAFEVDYKGRKFLMRFNVKEIIGASPPLPKKVTQKSRAHTIKESHRFRGSVRIGCGKFYTDDEFEARRKKILSTPLP